MKRGVVAIIDFLGFKGIWRRFPGEQAIADLKSLREAATSMRAVERDRIPLDPQMEAAARALNIEHRFLSDTIVICAWYDDQETYEREYGLPAGGGIVHAISLVALEVLGVFVRSFSIETGLNFRGCLSVGEFLMDETSIVGPAVDDAAEFHELSDGAFVWLTPRAQSTFEQGMTDTINVIGAQMNEDSEAFLQFMGDLLNPYFILHRLPLKGNRTLSAYTLNWLALGEYFPDDRWVRNVCLDRFLSDSLDVRIKRDNTEAFLWKCEQHNEATEELRGEIRKMYEASKKRAKRRKRTKKDP